MKKVGKVLVVDDNAGIRSALKILLPLRGPFLLSE